MFLEVMAKRLDDSFGPTVDWFREGARRWRRGARRDLLVLTIKVGEWLVDRNGMRMG